MLSQFYSHFAFIILCTKSIRQCDEKASSEDPSVVACINGVNRDVSFRIPPWKHCKGKETKGKSQIRREDFHKLFWYLSLAYLTNNLLLAHFFLLFSCQIVFGCFEEKENNKPGWKKWGGEEANKVFKSFGLLKPNCTWLSATL